MQSSVSRAAATTALLFTLGTADPAVAQEMCGDGTTYAVDLPVVDESPGGGLVFPFSYLLPDSIDVPKGCDVYVLIVSDVGRNRGRNELLFYPLAKFAAEHNGYVHYAWWNNLLMPYMEGTVHRAEPGVSGFGDPENHPGKRFTKQTNINEVPEALGDRWTYGEYEVIQSECHFTNPSTGPVLGSIRDVAGAAGCLALEAGADLFYSPVLRRPFPDSTKQFVADAAAFVRRTREENPNAVIVIAGHGLGAHASALVSQNVPVTAVDLLALIGPYASTSEPDGSEVTDSGLRGSRHRALRPIAGYARRDCVRNSFFLCQNFGTFFKPTYQCFTRNETLPERPPVGSFAPLLCPGPVVKYRNQVVAAKRVYHRWQTETGPPEDFVFSHYIYGNSYPNSPISSNSQFRMPGAVTGTPPAGGLCGDSTVDDPGLPGSQCSPFDGHDELVGFRGLRSSAVDLPGFSLQVDLRVPLGLQVGPLFGPLGRASLIEMATPDPGGSWRLRPQFPDLCLVCDDLVTITQELLDERDPGEPEPDVIAPVTTAVANPVANLEGWHAGDVQIALSATDAGAGVREIQHSLAGAQTSGVVITLGAAVPETIGTEGVTTITFLARDLAGNEEAARTLDVRIDRTPPDIAAVTDVPPNPNGWNTTDVAVTFPASDALSGLASSSPDVVVSAEGAGQEIVGTAEDKAGNLAAASAVVSIDKTSPSIVISTPPGGAVYLLNAEVASDYTCADGLSGLGSCVGPVASGAAVGTSAAGAKTFTVASSDVAGNHASSTHDYAVQYAFAGFFNPIRNLPMVNIVRAGRTVPVKYDLRDALGAFITDVGSFASLTSAAMACDASAPDVEVESTDAAGSTTIHYDLAANQFVYNWKTDAAWAGSCRMLQLTLDDGTTHPAVFEFN